jgi:hypothetical protein
LVGLLGIKEKMAIRPDGFGAMSGSASVDKHSVDPAIVRELETRGIVKVPIPEHLRDEKAIRNKVCQQYSDQTYHDNIWITHNQTVKFTAPYVPMWKLRQIPGFWRARYIDPLNGGKGNSMRFLAMAPRDDYMQVPGPENLFVAGEKSGILVGIAEVISTGLLAGHNAARQALGQPLLKISTDTMVGESIEWVGRQMETPEGLKQRYTFSGAVLLDHLKEKGLYTRDRTAIWQSVRQCGMSNIFMQ